jgi:predicted CoA-substrate-specific enzyme activase
MITAGIDIGSLSTKAVILDHENNIMGYDIQLTGGDNRKTGERVFQQAVSNANLVKEDIAFIITTGYGRENLPFSNGNVTEITCHAIGIHFLYPDARTVLDIGGQDSKAIKMDDRGQILDFVMNDKCAAGTGRFLEVIARALDVELEDLGEKSRQANERVIISSMCTVFAESEVVSLVAKGVPVPNIIKGVHHAIADRSIILLNKVGITEPIAMSGGVAKNKGVVHELEEKSKIKINIPDQPQIVGALGAALIAQKKSRKQT